jgi:AraC-like DNA-binding protein
MDPLSDVLSLLKPRSYMSGGIDAGGDWSFYFPQHEGIRCFAVASGSCWLAMEGVADPVRLEAGHCVVLPHARAFRLASDLSLAPIHFKMVLTAPLNGSIRSWNGGGSCLGLSAYFTFAGDPANVLLGVLPPIVHIRNEADRAAMRWCLERMMKELREPQPGSFLLGQHLAQMMLVEALRLYIAEGLRGGVGWLYALADKQIGPAMSAMHEDPAHCWTVQELAERAAMSRSIFAQKFKGTVGATPMEYLTRWRMLLAADRLKNTGDSISVISLSLGYESESAFGKAFKRIMGCSPRRYSRGQNSVTSPTSAEEINRFETVAAD